MKSHVSPSQIRAARALLAWSQEVLAERAGVGLSTVRDAETGKRVPMPSNMKSIIKALEVAGVLFIPGNGNGPGVRMTENLPEIVQTPYWDDKITGWSMEVLFGSSKIYVNIPREGIQIFWEDQMSSPPTSIAEMTKALTHDEMMIKIIRMIKSQAREHSPTPRVLKLTFPVSN